MSLSTTQPHDPVTFPIDSGSVLLILAAATYRYDINELPSVTSDIAEGEAFADRIGIPPAQRHLICWGEPSVWSGQCTVDPDLLLTSTTLRDLAFALKKGPLPTSVIIMWGGHGYYCTASERDQVALVHPDSRLSERWGIYESQLLRCFQSISAPQLYLLDCCQQMDATELKDPGSMMDPGGEQAEVLPAATLFFPGAANSKSTGGLWKAFSRKVSAHGSLNLREVYHQIRTDQQYPLLLNVRWPDERSWLRSSSSSPSNIAKPRELSETEKFWEAQRKIIQDWGD
tara:strand:+ start:3426 stop:4283 length:858 start_codon:yes stop_codon:yes gene_type:complete